MIVFYLKILIGVAIFLLIDSSTKKSNWSDKNE